jgi:general secretion pathway protein I
MRKWLSGFSLVEVLVATVILAISMTALLSSQVTSFYAITDAKRISAATFLARCRMSEIEAELIKEGLQVDTVSDDGECCEAGGDPEFTCRWTIEPPDLEALESDEAMGGAEEDPAGGEAGGSTLENLTSGASAQDMLQGSAAVGSEDIVSGIAGEFVWPLLIPSLVEQVRKVTVEVVWQEGDEERVETFVQYLVAETGPDTGAAPPQEGETP